MSEEARDAPAPETARAVIVPLPLERTVSFGAGTAKGTEAIIRASNALESYDERSGRDPTREQGIATLETADLEGDLPDVLDQIAGLAAAVLEAGQLPLFLGGEHSLTAGTIRPFAAAHDELAVLQFDAHGDLRESYRGDRYSHACAMARVLDHLNVSLVQVGLRSVSQPEAKRIAASSERINAHFAHEKVNWQIEEIVAPLAGKPIYVSFDVDCFDASLMPATGTPEPGGLFFDEACAILQAAGQAGQIVGGDVVELSPIEGLAACDVTAAKIAYKILGCALA